MTVVPTLQAVVLEVYRDHPRLADPELLLGSDVVLLLGVVGGRGGAVPIGLVIILIVDSSTSGMIITL